MGHLSMDLFPPLDILQSALSSALHKLCVATRPWRKVTGPAAVYVMVLARLGWRASSASSVTIHTKQKLDLFCISLAAAAALAVLATKHWSDTQATASLRTGSPGFSVYWDALRPLLTGRKPSGWTQRHRSAIIFLLAGGEWPQARQHTHGKTDDPICLRCNLAPCTLWHRRYQCDAWTFPRLSILQKN